MNHGISADWNFGQTAYAQDNFDTHAFANGWSMFLVIPSKLSASKTM
jgi:hypothetical protein